MPSKSAAAAGQHHAPVVNIGGDLGSKFGECIFYKLRDPANNAFNDRVDLAGCDLDRCRAAGLHITAADLESTLQCPRGERQTQSST